MARRSANINVMIRAAQKAARSLVRDFGEVEKLQVSEKGPANFVSIADTAAERIVREELTKARPEYAFLMEESGASGDPKAEFRWIVDPLDGTTNFLHGIPHFAISIGLEHKGEIVAGVILNPITDETFWAERNGGAFLDDQRLRVSARRRLTDAVVATGIPHRGRGDHPAFVKQLLSVMASVAGVRRFGAAALDLAYVAAGRCDAYWESGLGPWDIAAGMLIVREAGGLVTDFAGRSGAVAAGDLIAANQYLHTPLTTLLREASR